MIYLFYIFIFKIIKIYNYYDYLQLNGRPWKPTISNIHNHSSMKTTNSFVFSDIKVLDNGKRHTYWDTFLFRLKPFLRPFYRKLAILKEQGFEYNNIPLHTLMGADTCLYGYFQSYKYFDDVFPTIYRMLHIEEQKNKLLNTHNNIVNKLDNSISIHFRLGDYKIFFSCVSYFNKILL